MTGDNETNFPHELLLPNRQVIRKVIQIFVKPLQIIHQLILNYQKVNYQR